MNIDSIKNYPTGIFVKHKPEYGLESKQKSKSADLYKKEKNVNRGYYDGSLTRENVAAVNFTGNCLGKLKKYYIKGLDSVLNKVNPLCDGDTVIGQNLVALILAGIFRPVAIMYLPSDKKNIKDKMYAAAQAISSALIGFIFSTILMYPLGKGVKHFKKALKVFTKHDYENLSPEFLNKFRQLKGEESYKKLQNLINYAKKLKVSTLVDKLKDIYHVKNIKDLERSTAFKNTTKIIDMGPDVFAFGILKAYLTIKMIPPILKYFGWEKSKPQENPSMMLTAKMNMANFVGGQK